MTEGDGNDVYLAMDALREVHQGDIVRIQGQEPDARSEVRSVEPTFESPVLVVAQGEFDVKPGDLPEVVPVPGDELPAFIA